MRPIDADAIAHKLEGKFNQDMVRYAPTLDYKDLVPQGEHIAELLKAEADGRLVVLPCKVDDVVFVPLLGRVFLFDVISIICHNNKPTFKAQHGIHLVWVFGIDDFGKNVFLTREEAEAALRGADA